MNIQIELDDSVNIGTIESSHGDVAPLSLRMDLMAQINMLWADKSSEIKVFVHPDDFRFLQPKGN